MQLTHVTLRLRSTLVTSFLANVRVNQWMQFGSLVALSLTHTQQPFFYLQYLYFFKSHNSTFIEPLLLLSCDPSRQPRKIQQHPLTNTAWSSVTRAPRHSPASFFPVWRDDVKSVDRYDYYVDCEIIIQNKCQKKQKTRELHPNPVFHHHRWENSTTDHEKDQHNTTNHFSTTYHTLLK